MATQISEGTAAIQGPLWSERADDWATVHEHNMERLFADIPLDRVSTSMTINATAAILLALYLAVARKQDAERIAEGKPKSALQRFG